MVIVFPLMVRMTEGTAATTTTVVITTATIFSVRNVMTVVIKFAPFRDSQRILSAKLALRRDDDQISPRSFRRGGVFHRGDSSDPQRARVRGAPSAGAGPDLAQLRRVCRELPHHRHHLGQPQHGHGADRKS